MPNFMVLRNAAAVRTTSPFESFGLGASNVPAAPVPQVEVHDISTAEATSLANDPQVAAVAIPMPTALIAPVDVAGAAATNAWGIPAVKADTSNSTGDGVVVAVLDTGIDKTHPAFAGVTIVEQDFSGSGNGDKVGHGTHCAGTIFGRDADNTRIGIARGVKKALIGKVLGDNGGGSSEAIFRGIQWALDQGANVISMSLGFDFPGTVARAESLGIPTQPAVSNALEAYRSNLRFFDALMAMVDAQAAFRDTAVLVAAAGNESKRNGTPPFTIAVSLPAASKGVVSVAALGQGAGGKFNIAPFSNNRAQVAGPGVNILSAKVGGGLTTKSGTSMACPHVAGVAALWWEALRKSGQVRATASLVTANLVTKARTDVIEAGLTTDDRGAGMITAPQ
jgi:subtilisin family serine protease